MKKALIIGGSGFIGQSIAKELLSNNFHVSIFDLVDFDNKENTINFVSGSILNKELIDNEIAKVDVVYHLAGIADIHEAEENPSKTIEFNIIGSLNIIESCSKHKVKLMFASTVYVYSRYGSFYRITKQSIELMLEEYSKKYGFNYTILRYGSLYGPNSQDWNSVKRSISKMIKDKRIVVNGTGSERREFIHVKDAAKLSLLALNEKYTNKAVSITGIQVLTQSELMNIIKEIINQDVDIIFDSSKGSRGHYQLTPYQYTPKHAIKIISNEYIDIGQGILEIIEEIHADE